MITTKTVNPFWEDIKHLFQYDINTRSIRDFGMLDMLDAHWENRKKYCRIYAWAVADPASIAFVAKYLGPRAIEIGAGNGYWSWQLSQSGVDILAYDENPPDQTPNFYFVPREELPNPKTLTKIWYPVQQGSIEKLTEYPDRTLFLCWPPYGEPMATECLNAYRGDRFVYIGEDCGGCTGDKEFFEILEQQWEEIADHDIKQWQGVHDRIAVYQRITSSN